VLSTVEKDNAFRIIKSIRPIVYTSKYGFDNKIFYGFLAQEVENVFPECISYVKGIIPDYREHVSSDNMIIKGNTVKIKKQNNVQIEIGEILDVQCRNVSGKIDKISKQVAVISSDLESFTIDGTDLEIGTGVDINGRHVDDFRCVNYLSFIPLLVKTVQTMCDEIEKLKNDIQRLTLNTETK
jgi:hypothetical protein